MIVVGASPEPLAIAPWQLIGGSRTVRGWASGTPADTEDALRFSVLAGVRPMIETFPLDKVAEAYGRMITSKVRFRAVLTM